MKRAQRWWTSTSIVLSSAALLTGCCKSNADHDTPRADPFATEKTLTPSSDTPTPISASTDDYQNNGFPAAMPKTRTAVPTVSEWSKAPPITTKKFPDGCSMKFVREWLKINCSKDTDTATPLRITSITGLGSEGGDYFKFEKSGKVLDLVVRTKDGKKGSAIFVTDRGSYQVGYDWPYRAPFPSTVFQ